MSGETIGLTTIIASVKVINYFFNVPPECRGTEQTREEQLSSGLFHGEWTN
jgi:hypothetical protein